MATYKPPKPMKPQPGKPKGMTQPKAGGLSKPPAQRIKPRPISGGSTTMPKRGGGGYKPPSMPTAAPPSAMGFKPRSNTRTKTR